MKRSSRERPPGTETSPVEPFLWWGVQATIVFVPLFISTGRDVYRLPKLLLVQAAALVIFGACAVVSLVDPRRGILQRLHRHRTAVIIAAAAVGWTALATVFSTQPLLSAETLFWVTCCAAFYLAAVALAERVPVWSAAAVLIAALINTIVSTLQRLEIWSPVVFQAGLDLRARSTAYLGNADDYGAYLFIPVLMAGVLAIVSRKRARVVYGAIAVLLLAGLIISETLTALVALAAAVTALLFCLSRRLAWRVLIVSAGVLALAFVLRLPVTTRVTNVVSQMIAGDIHGATSYRLEGFQAAWLMFLDHPVTGVGPGCFGFWFLPYDMLLTGKNPDYLNSTLNFHEVHNDHLQLMATTGVIGYAIFLAAMVWLGMRARGEMTTPRQRFGRLLAAPAAAGITMVTLGAFALELAAPTATYLYLAALVTAWSRSA